MSVSAQSILSLTAFLVVTFAAAAIGAQFEPGLWYESLEKPPWNPPNWVFAPVWSILYILMATAAWLVWTRLRAFGWPLVIWLIQLGLNSVWSWVFFGLQQPGLAVLEIVTLLAAIVATVIAFFRTHRAASLLLVPYLFWVAFAALLNFSIWRLNS